MDYDLKQKHAPRRDNRHPQFQSLKHAAAQASVLEWRTNDYDFFRLCHCLFDYLDSRYRGFGFRIDQFVSFDELARQARREIESYDELKLAEHIDFFRFLYASFDLWIGGLANEALDRRRTFAKTLANGD